MTTQVFLLNALGVVVASDSTISTDAGQFHSDRKLLDLPPPHLLVVTCAGSATFMGIPWEILIRQWGQSLSGRLETIAEYRNSLNDYLKHLDLPALRAPKTEMDFLHEVLEANEEAITEILRDSFAELTNKLTEEDISTWIQSDWDPDFRDRMTTLVTDRMKERCLKEIHEEASTNLLMNAVFHWSFPRWESPEDFLSDYPAADERLSRFLTGWPAISGLQEETLRYVLSGLLGNHDNHSTIGMAGYGSAQMTPSYDVADYAGSLAGQVVWGNGRTSEKGMEPDYLLVGQRSAIEWLTEGKDPRVQELADAHADELDRVFDFTDTALAGLRSSRAVGARAQLRNHQTAIRSAKESPVKDPNRASRFIRLIRCAPIDDLAALAERLVAVQKLDASIMEDLPSVGGSIDVVQVSLVEGVVWTINPSKRLSF